MKRENRVRQVAVIQFLQRRFFACNFSQILINNMLWSKWQIRVICRRLRCSPSLRLFFFFARRKAFCCCLFLHFVVVVYVVALIKNV